MQYRYKYILSILISPLKQVVEAQNFPKILKIEFKEVLAENGINTIRVVEAQNFPKILKTKFKEVLVENGLNTIRAWMKKMKDKNTIKEILGEEEGISWINIRRA